MPQLGSSHRRFPILPLDIGSHTRSGGLVQLADSGQSHKRGVDGTFAGVDEDIIQESAKDAPEEWC